MIFDIPMVSFILIMLCAFFAGCAGAVCVILIAYSIKKKASLKKESAIVSKRSQDSAWQRIAQDEQLYNGR